jgi:long-chain acyl-CoA synthetase
VIPGEIETVLLQHPDVSQAVVIGAPHPVYGEQIVAFTVLERDCGMNDLYQFCAERIAGYKVPDVIRSIEEIPVRQGKADKLMLRNQFLQS